MSETQIGSPTGILTLELISLAPDGEVALGSVGDVLDALHVIIVHLDVIYKESHGTRDGWLISVPALVGAEMRSPLRISVALTFVQKNAAKAIMELVKKALFYMQEKTLRTEEATLEWEAAHIARLHNVSEAMRAARGLSPETPSAEMPPMLLHRRVKPLLDAVEKLERCGLRATVVQLEEKS